MCQQHHRMLCTQTNNLATHSLQLEKPKGLFIPNLYTYTSHINFQELLSSHFQDTHLESVFKFLQAIKCLVAYHMYKLLKI